MAAARADRRRATREQRPRAAPQGPGGRPIRRKEGHGPGIVVGVAFVVLVGTFVLWSLARNASRGNVNLGNGTFELGDTEDRVRTIERRGPLLFQALIGETDLWVNRVGGTWVAFRAAAPGQPRECSVVYRPEAGDFADPCTGTAYPADGRGLEHVLVEDRQGRLVVDLRAPISGPGGQRLIDPAATIVVRPPTTAPTTPTTPTTPTG